MRIFLKLATILASLITAITIFGFSQAHAVGFDIIPQAVDENTPLVTIQFSGLSPNKEYQLCLSDNCVIIDELTAINLKSSSSGTITITTCGDGGDLKTDCGQNDYFHHGTYKAYLFDNDAQVAEASFRVVHYYPGVILTPEHPKPGDVITIAIGGRRRPLDDDTRNNYEVSVESTDGGGFNEQNHCLVSPGTTTFGPLADGEYLAKINELVTEGEAGGCRSGFTYYHIKFTVDPDGGTQEIIKDPNNEDDLPENAGRVTQGKNPCVGGVCPTALGDIPTNIGAFTEKILNLAIGLAGGIALILMVIGSIRVLTSSGDQQRLAGGRDMIIAAVAGLLFLIFSVLILRFIGVEILDLSFS